MGKIRQLKCQSCGKSFTKENNVLKLLPTELTAHDVFSDVNWEKHKKKFESKPLTILLRRADAILHFKRTDPA
jgi:hypothetical protein